jgi:hypothetical protein
VKRTLIAIMFFGLAIAAAFQSTPAHAQSTLARTREAGSIFQPVSTPSPYFNNAIFASSASSPTDIWAVGDEAMHYNGKTWQSFPVPNVAGNNTSLLQGVVDISPTLAWAVGNVVVGSPSGQFIDQWNGKTWSPFPGPSLPAGSQADLFAMASTSKNDIWAVGNLVESGGNEFNLFEHYDGTAWSATTIFQVNFVGLTGAFADATNDVWAVGLQATDIDFTFATHYNGSTWDQVDTPNVGSGSNELEAVLALAPNNVWAVGFYVPNAPPINGNTQNLIEHYDGSTWSVVPSPNVGNGNQANRLLGLTGKTANDLWAFGSSFAANGSGFQSTLVMHYNGTAWEIVPSPDPTSGNFLADVLFTGVTPSAGNLWIFGSEDQAHDDGSLALHTLKGNQ